MSSWQEQLRRFTPDLVDNYGLTRHQWHRVEEKLAQRNSALEPQLKKKKMAPTPTTIYDLVVLALSGDDTAARFLAFVNDIASDLAQLLPQELIPSAREQTRNLFMDFSTTKSAFREKIGELAAVVYILKQTGGKPLQFEIKLSDNSNKRIDLCLEMIDGKPIVVEILNIFVNDEKLSTDADLNDFLDGRISKKIKEKTGQSLPADKLPFPLLLILWFNNVFTIKQFSSAIIKRASGNELPACVLQQFMNIQGKKSWKFSSVARLMSDYEFV